MCLGPIQQRHEVSPKDKRRLIYPLCLCAPFIFLKCTLYRTLGVAIEAQIRITAQIAELICRDQHQKSWPRDSGHT